MRRLALASLLLTVLVPTARLVAQETPPPATTPAPAADPAPTPAAPSAMAEPIAYRPIEGPTIINLPSVDVPKKGTLTLLFAHRFSQPVAGSSIDDLFTFDSAANIGIGLGYAPVKNFALFFYRYSNANKTYEVSGKYSALDHGPLAISLGVGGDFRTKPDPDPPSPFNPPVTNRSTFFAQAIFAYTPFPWLRITAEPTYLNHTAGLEGYTSYAPPAELSTTVNVDPEPFYANVFNVPVAASVAITHSITLHAEIVPSYRRAVQVTNFNCGSGPSDPVACPTVSGHSSPGVGWIVSVEKALLRHRFAFTAGNLRETTMDQYLLPNFAGFTNSGSTGSFPKNVYLGFVISRTWGLIK
jgi:hypothetical protein